MKLTPNPTTPAELKAQIEEHLAEIEAEIKIAAPEDRARLEANRTRWEQRLAEQVEQLEGK